MKRNQSGFTLIELMTVMMIMALMMFIAVGAFKDFGRSVGMRGASLGVKTSLNMARQRAITHRDRIYFVYGTDTNSMPKKGYYYVRNDEEDLSNTNFCPKGTYFEGPDSKIEFKLDGSCDAKTGIWNGSVSYIGIREEQGVSYLARTVSVFRLTGRSRIDL
jgi:prepilin-type N-terminal cleavage/methylation domain-containing protein